MLNDQRKNELARLCRTMTPREHLRTRTLDGKSEYRISWCTYHKEWHKLDKYYLINGRPRPMCIEAWDLTNGKLPDEIRTPSPELPLDFSEEGGRVKSINKKKRMPRNRPCLTTRRLVFEEV